MGTSKNRSDFLSALLLGSKTQNITHARDILMTLLFAGRDSTQNAILWALYELTRHPSWISSMRQELEARPPCEADGIITYGELTVRLYRLHLIIQL